MNNLDLCKEAKGCKDCIGWLKYCDAECCKNILILRAKLDKRKKYLFVHIKEAPIDKIVYWGYKGVIYSRSTLKFQTKYCVQDGDNVIFKKDCIKLKDNLCILHDTHKPKFCKMLDETTALNPGHVLTENCLYKYKIMKENKNGSKQESKK